MKNTPPEMSRSLDILLVEDDPSDVLLIKRGLEQNRLYHSLSVAKDGVEAIQFLRNQDPFDDAPRPDLILLDLNMPRMDGRELLRELKSDGMLKQIPVVVLTTSDADTDIIDSYELQASCYVTKPVGLDQFSDAVKSI